MSDNLNSGSLLSSLSSSSRPTRTSTPMTSSGSSILPGSMTSQQRQAINREFLNNQTKQTNLLNSNAALNNLAMQNQGMMNQFNSSLMRQMGAIDAAANKITSAINTQTTQLVSAITNMSNSITDSLKSLQDGINNLFYDRASAYSSKLMHEEDENTYDEYAKNFVKTVFSEKITNLLAKIEFVSLKEVKELTLKYFMQNKTFASAIGLSSPLGSKEFNKMVPFTKDIADAILDSARHLLVIANGITNITSDTPQILEHFGGSIINKQDTLININTNILRSLNRVGNILDAFSHNYMNINQARATEPMQGAIEVIQEVTGASNIRTQRDLAQTLTALRGQLAIERDLLERYRQRDDPNSEYNRRRAQIEQDIHRTGGAERDALRRRGNLTRQERARLRTLNTQLQVYDQELTDLTARFTGLRNIPFGRNSLQNTQRTRGETEREVARLEEAIRRLNRGTRNQRAFDALVRDRFGIGMLEGDIRQVQGYAQGRSGRFSNSISNNPSNRQERQREQLIESLRDVMNKNAYQTEENTKALGKSITAMDVMKTSLLAALNPKNIFTLGNWGYKLFKFITPFFMYRMGLQLLTGNMEIPLIGGTIPGLLKKPVDYVSGIDIGGKTIGARAGSIWNTVKETLATFYNTHLKGIWESIKENLASFKETFIGWIGKDWWMRIYDTWEAVKKYTSLGWDAFLNPDTSKAAVAREQIASSIKSAFKEVVIKYLLPGMMYGAGAYTAIKNVMNPGRFVSNLFRPVGFLARRFGGGARMRVANFNEASQVLQSAALDQLQQNSTFGLSNVRVNLANGRFNVSAVSPGAFASTDFTNRIDQSRLIRAGSATLMRNWGVSREVAEGWLREAASGGGLSYGFARVVRGISNGLRGVTRVLNAFMKGTTWVFNIGTTIFSLYKVWGFLREKIESVAKSDGIVGGLKEMALYSVKKGLSTLLDVAKDIKKEMPVVFKAIYEAGKEAWRENWPGIKHSAKEFFMKTVLPQAADLFLSACHWIADTAKKVVNQDEVSLAIKRAEEKQIKLLDQETKDNINRLKDTNKEVFDTNRTLQELHTQIALARSLYIANEMKTNAGKRKDIDAYNRELTNSINQKLAKGDLSLFNKDTLIALKKRNPSTKAASLNTTIAEDFSKLSDTDKQLLIQTLIGATNRGGISGTVEGKYLDLHNRKEFFESLTGKNMFSATAYKKDDKGNIILDSSGNPIVDENIPKHSFTNILGVVEALKTNKENPIARALLKNYIENIEKVHWLNDSSFAEIFRDIETEIRATDNMQAYEENMTALIGRLNHSQSSLIHELERNFAELPEVTYKTARGAELQSTGRRLFEVKSLSDVYKIMGEDIGKTISDGINGNIQRQQAAFKLSEAEKARKEEEKRVAEIEAKKAAEKAKKENEDQEKKGFLSWFGFSNEGKSGAGSLGVVAQWVQSGQFKRMMDTVGTYIGDKIGGIIKFFKSQNYGKMFSDVMSGLGSATGGILSALFGADKADSFTRNAYKYAVKKDLKYAKAFFGGARRSILTSVEDLVSHAAKTNQNLQEIIDWLTTQGEDPANFKNLGPAERLKYGISKGESDWHKKITDEQGNYRDYQPKNNDEKFDIGFTEAFAREGAGINYKELYKGTERMLSRYGMLAINMPDIGQKDKTIGALLKDYGITETDKNKIWKNWEGQKGYRAKFEKFFKDPKFAEWAETHGHAKEYFRRWWNENHLDNFTNHATAGILLGAAYNGGSGGMREILGNVLNQYSPGIVSRVKSVNPQTGKVSWSYPASITTDQKFLNIANSRGSDFAAALLTEQRARYRRISTNPTKAANLPGWLARTERTAKYYGFQKRGEVFVSPYGRVMKGLRDPEINKTVKQQAEAKDVDEFVNGIKKENFASRLHSIALDKKSGSGYTDLLGGTSNISDTNYERVLKFSEKYSGNVTKVAEIMKKDPSKVTQEEAEMMADLISVFKSFIKQTGARDATNTVLLNNFTTYNKEMNSKLNTIMAKKGKDLDANKVNEKRNKVLEHVI